MLSETRNEEAAERFFRQVLSNEHCSDPRVISVDKNLSYLPAFKAIKDAGLIPENSQLRQIKYLNNRIEQDHRFSKKRMRSSQWFQTFETAQATIAGDESMYMIRKEQVRVIKKGDFAFQKKFIENLFGIVA